MHRPHQQQKKVCGSFKRMSGSGKGALSVWLYLAIAMVLLKMKPILLAELRLCVWAAVCEYQCNKQ